MSSDGPRRTASRDDRAVSITVNYVIVLGITAVLISGLLIGAGGYVQDQRTNVVREQLTVVAEQLAAGITDADRLSRAEARSLSVRVGVNLPARVAGESYRIAVDNVSAPGQEPMEYELRLRSASSDVSVTLRLSTLVALEERSVNGGWVVLRLDASDSTLVLENGDPSESLSLTEPSLEGTRK